MDRADDMEYAQRALEYEMIATGFSSGAVARVKSMMNIQGLSLPLVVEDDLEVGDATAHFMIHLGRGHSGLPGISAYDLLHKGNSHTFDRHDIFWPTGRQAIKLLDGEAVGRSIISPVEGIAVVEWFRLDFSWKEVTGVAKLENLGFFNLETEIRLLPIREQHYPGGPEEIYSSILAGERPSVYYHHRTEVPATLHVDAIRQCIVVMDQRGNVVTDTIALAVASQRTGIGAQYSFNSNINIMRNSNYSDENLNYNISRLRQHGIPDTKDNELRERMQQGEARILLDFHSAEYAGDVRVTAHIEKADTGAYFPNRYELELKQPGSQYVRRQFIQIQNFKGHGRQYDIPWRMGVNLLKGGQVLNHWLKENGTVTYEWRGLNFSQRTNAGYGFVSFEPQVFDVAAKLNELPIQEKDKEDLRHSHVVRSIEIGNSQVVHIANSTENLTIRLRANVPKRDFDIIQGGHVISMDQFKTQLLEWRSQGLYTGVASWEQDLGNGHGTARADGTIKSPANEASGQNQQEGITQQHASLLEAGKQTGNVMVVSPGRPPAQEKTMKVLTGNPITPASPSGKQKSIKP